LNESQVHLLLGNCLGVYKSLCTDIVAHHVCPPIYICVLFEDNEKLL
jgi:hypothetical protein